MNVLDCLLFITHRTFFSLIDSGCNTRIAKHVSTLCWHQLLLQCWLWNFSPSRHNSLICNTIHVTYRTELFGNQKKVNFVLLLLPLHPGTKQYCVPFIMDLHKFIIQ